MLQTQSIEPSTLGLLKSLMSRDYLDGFNLVGGTALALYMGHRKSMKLNEISISGQRSKDFIDIYFILEEHKYSVADMLKFYQTKYSQHGDMHVLKSLIYFNDVDLSDWPVLIKKPRLKWPAVTSRIEKEVLRFVKEQVQPNDEK